MNKLSASSAFAADTFILPDHYAEDCPKCRSCGAEQLVRRYIAQAAEARADRTVRRHRHVAYDDVAADPLSPRPLRSAKAALSLLTLNRTSADSASVGSSRRTRRAIRRGRSRTGWRPSRSPSPSRWARTSSSRARPAMPAPRGRLCRKGWPAMRHLHNAAGSAGPLLMQMRAYGATVLAVENKADRWTADAACGAQFGWFPHLAFFGPVVGSNPYGIEGYKTLLTRSPRALNWGAGCCIVPVCYGDALIGMWRGFEDMRALGWTDSRAAACRSGNLRLARARRCAMARCAAGHADDA